MEVRNVSKRKPNPWKGFILGAIGGIAGIVAMEYYWKAASAVKGADPRQEGMRPADAPPGPLDNISLVGQNYRPGESSTTALGRILYHAATGKDPDAETKNMLSYLISWVFSVAASGVYGAMRGRKSLLDVKGGSMLAAGLWGFNDELVVPLMGLSAGPTQYTLDLHAHALGSHLAYGWASAIATQALEWVFRKA